MANEVPAGRYRVIYSNMTAGGHDDFSAADDQAAWAHAERYAYGSRIVQLARVETGLVDRIQVLERAEDRGMTNIEGIETGTARTTRVIGRDACRAVRAAWHDGIVTKMAVDGAQVAAIVPLDDQGYPVGLGGAGELLSQLGAVDRAQAEVERSWSRSADEAELTELRALAEAVRAVQHRFEVQAIREDTGRIS